MICQLSVIISTYFLHKSNLIKRKPQKKSLIDTQFSIYEVMRVETIFKTMLSLNDEQTALLHLLFPITANKLEKEVKDFPNETLEIYNFGNLKNLLTKDDSDVAFTQKNQGQIKEIRSALERHPDVFLEVVKTLQNQSSYQDDTVKNEEEDQAEEQVAAVVGIHRK